MKEINDLNKYGVSYVKNYLSEQKCSEIRNEIDKNILKYNDKIKNCDIDINSSDKRLYGFENLSKNTMEILHGNSYVVNILNKLYKTDNIVGTIMAQRTDADTGNMGSAGYWHRDSL